MKRSLLCAALVVATGCAPQSDEAVKAKPAAPKHIVLFRTKLGPFVEETRAIAKRRKMEWLTLKEIDEKLAKIKDLYARMPEVPSELDKDGVISKLIRNIFENIDDDRKGQWALEYSGMSQRAFNAATGDSDGKRATEHRLKEASVLAKLVDELEAQSGLLDQE